jgi:UPF0755 protein
VTRPPVRGDDEYRPRHAAPPAGDDEYDEYDEHEQPQYADGAYEADWAERDDWEEDPDAEYEELRPESSRGRRVLVVLGSLVLVMVLVVAAAAFYVKGQLDPGGEVGTEVLFTVETGMSANAVASKLEDEGIIADAQIFRLYLRYQGTEGFQAGSYDLFENMAAWDVVDVLAGPPRPPDQVVFQVPPGLTLAEIPQNITDDIPTFDAAQIALLLAGGTIRPTSLPPEVTTLEGFVFPDRYDILIGEGPEAAIGRMVQQFDAVAAEIDLAGRAAALGMTPYEIVIIASLIEEEYGIPEEMGKIARVIYNRLEIDEPLGIDATSRYEAVLAGRDRDDLDFESESPYNTRRQVGLPPTPIAQPSRAALEAALSPVDGPWIFYVRDPDESRTPPGGHFFTESAREFENVKAECEAADLGCG